MKEYTIKELRVHLGKIIDKVYTSKESVLVTKRGKACVKISFYDGTVESQDAQGSTIPEGLSKDALEVAKKPLAERLEIARASILEYGCGCKKVEKSPLCERHGRY
jgi:prevent-host-death family protein